MMQEPEIAYKSLLDYSALSTLRDLCKNGATGVTISDIPLPDLASLSEEAGRCPTQLLSFRRLGNSNNDPAVPPAILKLMKDFHEIAAAVFKNLSHVVELPWEKYLSDIHEFEAEGSDELCIFKDSKVPRAWSTLTLVVNTSASSSCYLIFGDALRVFSGECIATRDSKYIDTLPSTESSSKGLLAYYVRPNDDVFYHRVAGVAMAPLSEEEHVNRRKVRELHCRLQVAEGSV